MEFLSYFDFSGIPFGPFQAASLVLAAICVAVLLVLKYKKKNR